uniref:Uncharacterized protein n=1 Tax=Triticum urartu TaxID=4572 RepID=A0A8R7R613_TRIUA
MAYICYIFFFFTAGCSLVSSVCVCVLHNMKQKLAGLPELVGRNQKKKSHNMKFYVCVPGVLCVFFHKFG